LGGVGVAHTTQNYYMNTTTDIICSEQKAVSSHLCRRAMSALPWAEGAIGNTTTHDEGILTIATCHLLLRLSSDRCSGGGTSATVWSNDLHYSIN